MKVSDLKTKLNYEEVCAGDSDADIRSGYTSDLLSDVMGNALDDSVLVTIQAHKNTIAVATLVGMAAVVICNNREVPQDMIDAANDEEVAVFRTGKNQFAVSCEIGALLD